MFQICGYKSRNFKNTSGHTFLVVVVGMKNKYNFNKKTLNVNLVVDNPICMIHPLENTNLFTNIHANLFKDVCIFNLSNGCT